MQMQHPTFADVTFETDDVEAAVASGWLKPNDEANPLNGKTVAELHDIATERGVDLTGVTRKADIIAALGA